jgi:hypothetical protein
LSKIPYGCLTPRETGRLTVGRNVTLTLTPEVKSQLISQSVMWLLDRAAKRRSSECTVSQVLLWLCDGDSSGIQEGERPKWKACT